MNIWIKILLLSLLDLSHSVEVHFETADSGFFLKHTLRQSPVSPEISTSTVTRARKLQDSVLSVDRFTVVQTTQPVSIRASYGPFSTKQTVPARYIVPDVVETQMENSNNTTAALMELQQSNLHLDISAHLVRNTIPRDSPILRVLFHAGADPGGHLQRQKICVLLHVSLGNKQPLKGRCMPEGEDGVCVAEVVIPSNWWPQLPPPDKNSQNGMPPKVPQRLAQISYSVFEPPTRNPEQCEPKVQIQPLTSFAQVPLIAAQSAYKDLRADGEDPLTILIPQRPLYPMSKIHVPVYIQQQSSDQNIALFIIRARVKAGMKILGATTSSDQWSISIEKENPKHTVARVTAYRKDQDTDSKDVIPDPPANLNKVVEVFSWLLEVANDTRENWDGGKIVWSVSYVYDSPKMKDSSAESTGGPPEKIQKKLIAKLEINKDDIQSVLPISKNWELMNTAVLTGRQVSQAMKVFIVSQAGKVADVTLQCSCHAEDESTIKVSSSCSSVYVDGSEIRGSSNASVIVKYGTYMGIAKFIVWMPEFPLEVYVSDFRLSQIKGWKVPEDHHYNHGKMNKRKKRAYGWSHHDDDFMNVLGNDKIVCRARYQQSPVEVYARFLAVDQNSGRVSYLISRRTGLRVTDLVQPLLRVADPKIASLKSGILQGKSMGRTDVQVLSPITGRVIGAKEIRVGSDKVSLTRLIVRVVSGLQLNITPDNSIENGYIAETSVTRRLTAQYQEGLLDIDLEFSDGARTPLRDVSVDDYFLLVESLDTEVVAFAPMLASHHPRVIAVGEGNGDLLRVTLLLSEECRARRGIPSISKQTKAGIGPLAVALASVQVDFNPEESVVKPDTVQNDGIMGRDRKSFRDGAGDVSDIIGIPLKDDSNHGPNVQARQHRGGITTIDGLRHKPNHESDMTSMEIGMYVLLTAFCFAIVVFVISCVVYASKFRPITIESGLDPTYRSKDILTAAANFRGGAKKESTTNAHDWVWLGRSTMDRSSVVQHDNVFENPRDSRIRITSNPMNLNYADPDDVINKVTSFDSGKPEEINSSTYSKNDNRPINGHDDLPPAFDDLPPPLPPHNRNNNDYRPPVPPHRNIGVTAGTSNGLIEKESVPQPVIKRSHHKHHHRNHNNRRSQVHGNIDLIRSYDRPIENKLNFTQEQLNAAFSNQKTHQRSPEQTFSPQEISPLDEQNLHMAERLAAQQQKNAFQFDSLTPKRDSITTKTFEANSAGTSASDPKDVPLKIEDVTDVKRKMNKKITAIPQPMSGTTTSSSDDNGGFITPPPSDGDEKQKLRKSQIKRATVVGNPMFSTTQDGDIGPGESLGLDDLDMDYEQIMHYFDNLKESNA